MNTQINRRQFTTVAGTIGAGLALGLEASYAEDRKAPVVDTHVHCFAGKNDRDFPYHERGPYQPELATPPEHLLKRMKEAGVDYAIIVHPEPYQDDHRYLEHCLKVGKDSLKGTCLFFADKEASVKAMKELVQRNPQKIVALRIHAYAPERLPPFEKPELKRLWKAASELGLAIQLHFEPRYASGFEPFIKEFPKTTVIIDHLGRPFQGKPEEHATVMGWAKYDNTIMKLSSIPDKRMYPHRDITPIIRDLAKAYTPQRLIYGGGFDEKATGESYKAYREQILALLDRLPAADQASIFGLNAAKLFAFPS
jgi:predicted TIM-barrel fold metal-dependent hydrolase